MLRNEHLILCGGVDRPQKARLRLNPHGPSANIRLRIEDISARLVANIPDALVDLLEVASYIYAADSVISRGGKTDAQMGALWRRKFRFVIPVRLPELWSSDHVQSALVETLSFPSEDDYAFEFEPFDSPPTVEGYFDLPDDERAGFTPDEVIMFSGGLDSFAGTVEELAANGKKVALVSHRSATKIAGVQEYLVDKLRCRFGADRVMHVPVWVTLDGIPGRESTHRTRSFLFAALGAVTAHLFRRDRICFFENGVVSLNLPPVAQVVGARATRTTHPQALAGFRRVLASILGRPFDVDNPFAWLTKSEVIERISASGCGDLIRHTRSCTRVRDMTKIHSHCGQCSQCIDRRFAVLAAGQEREDPDEAYKVDLFSGERGAGPDREMALSYIRAVSTIDQMEDVAFFAHYGETSRVVGYFPESASQVAGHIFDLHQRHAAAVCRVFDKALSLHASALREGKLPADCLLVLGVSGHDDERVYADRSGALEPAATKGSDIRIAIDDKRIVVDRWGTITGASAELIINLAEPFRRATRDELVPEHYPLIATEELRRQVGCVSNEAFRRRVRRCRQIIAKLAKKAGDPEPSVDAVIENLPWHGYRLNPDRIRIVALSELLQDK